MIAAERETVATGTAADELVTISSAQRSHITRLRKHPRFTEVSSEWVDGTECAVFTIPASEWNPATGGKRKSTLTDEQKKAAADRLRAAREASRWGSEKEN